MRYQNNLEVLKFLKTGVSFTDYTGFGGLHKNMTDIEKAALHALLGYDLYSEVMASCKTAYYTPAEIIKAMYNGIVKMGFKGGKILEPACGHGAFIFNSPDVIKNNSTFYAVELERISAKLTRGRATKRVKFGHITFLKYLKAKYSKTFSYLSLK